MKKRWKIFWIVCAVLAVAGILLSVAGVALGGLTMLRSTRDEEIIQSVLDRLGGSIHREGTYTEDLDEIPDFSADEGYVPGEQPKLENLCKLNTNENAFPPSPAVKRAIAELDWERLRRYPDPLADALRDKIAEVFGLKRENVIAGNGSDDILTMVFRCFTSPELPMACLYPTYSLYPELAKMQGAAVIPVPLAPRTFELPGDLLKRV